MFCTSFWMEQQFASSLVWFWQFGFNKMMLTCVALRARVPPDQISPTPCNLLKHGSLEGLIFKSKPHPQIEQVQGIIKSERLVVETPTSFATTHANFTDLGKAISSSEKIYNNMPSYVLLGVVGGWVSVQSVSNAMKVSQGILMLWNQAQLV